MDDVECRRRFRSADHGCLGTVSPDGAPHVVPVVFDLDEDDRIVVAVDHKPKRTQALRRLANIEAEPRVAFLVEEYSADWDHLWWVRADGLAVVVTGGPQHDAAVSRLRRRYTQYARTPPTGPVILTTVRRWTGWSAR